MFYTGSYTGAGAGAAADNFWTTFQISFIFGSIDRPDL